MSTRHYRAAWLARLNPTSPGPLTSGDIAALMGIVGRVTDLPTGEWQRDPQHNANLMSLTDVRNGVASFDLSVGFGALRRELGLRESLDLESAVNRLRAVQIGGFPAFGRLDVDRKADTLHVGLYPGRQVVSAHPAFDVSSRDRRRRGMASFDVATLASMSCVHSILILARLAAWSSGYDHGLRRSVSIVRHHEACVVRVDLDDAVSALGLVGLKEFRLADMRRQADRITADLALVGMRVHWSWEYEGRRPTHLTLTTGEFATAVDVPAAAVPLVVPAVHANPAPAPAPAVAPIDPAPAVEPRPDDLLCADLPYDVSEPALDCDERGRMSVEWWLTATAWPDTGLEFIHGREPFQATLRCRDMDVAYDVDIHKGHRRPPFRMESRYIQVTMIYTHEQRVTFWEAQKIAERLRNKADQDDYRREVGHSPDEDEDEDVLSYDVEYVDDE